MEYKAYEHMLFFKEKNVVPGISACKHVYVKNFLFVRTSTRSFGP